MERREQRSEPRFALGEKLQVALKRGSGWQELMGMTINVSNNGVLVSLVDSPEIGETVRVRTLADEDWSEAEVRHVVRGTTSSLVGLRLQQTPASWFVWRRTTTTTVS